MEFSEYRFELEDKFLYELVNIYCDCDISMDMGRFFGNFGNFRDFGDCGLYSNSGRILFVKEIISGEWFTGSLLCLGDLRICYRECYLRKFGSDSMLCWSAYKLCEICAGRIEAGFYPVEFIEIDLASSLRSLSLDYLNCFEEIRILSVHDNKVFKCIKGNGL